MGFNNLLDRTCTIQENAVTQDAAMEKIKTWTNVLTNVKCRLDPIGGGLVNVPPVVYKSATHELFMLAQSGLTITAKQHRIVIGSDTYTILLVPDLHGYKDTHHLELLLELDE